MTMDRATSDDERVSWDFSGIERDRALVAQVFANASKGNGGPGKPKRQPRTGEKRKAKQANAVGRRKFTHHTTPWNKDGELKLFLCESVRATLPSWSTYR